MSQVLNFGFPQGERLRCDNPLCDELANRIAKVPNALGDGDREIFGCTTHFDQLIWGQRVIQHIKLVKEGERNA
jgi:hypothetical protein